MLERSAGRSCHGPKLKEADARLDRENKRLYAILTALFRDNETPEYELVHGIPTTAAAQRDTEPTATPGETGPSPDPK